MKTITNLSDTNCLEIHGASLEAFNSAWDQYKDKDDRRDDASREETAHKVAWAAVKNSYEKGDDDKWHKKK
ncbi:ChaB family protein [Klebsiella quasipneumoniae]|uniref:ChaB family protein n=1 Tax=Klebsiella quasipneumoniae TaxID=1463165 RepID=UPI0015C59174|nr:ChaB family protein [Klebsiella quasipneumoniae]